MSLPFRIDASDFSSLLQRFTRRSPKTGISYFRLHLRVHFLFRTPPDPLPPRETLAAPRLLLVRASRALPELPPKTPLGPESLATRRFPTRSPAPLDLLLLFELPPRPVRFEFPARSPAATPARLEPAVRSPTLPRSPTLLEFPT